MLDRVLTPSPGLRVAPGGVQAGPIVSPLQSRHTASTARRALVLFLQPACWPSAADDGTPGDNQQRLITTCQRSKHYKLEPIHKPYGSALRHISGMSPSLNLNYTNCISINSRRAIRCILLPELRSRYTVGGEQLIYLAPDSNTT